VGKNGSIAKQRCTKDLEGTADESHRTLEGGEPLLVD
jgi:hypothetical protein